MLQEIHKGEIGCIVVKVLIQATECEDAYEKQYTKFRKLLSASSKYIPPSEIVDCIDQVVVDYGGKLW